MLLTDEDLTQPPVDNVNAAAGLLTAPARSLLPVSAAVEDFAREALEETLARSAARWQAPAGPVFAAEELDAVVAWVRDAGLDTLVVSHLPTGPASALLNRLRTRLPVGVSLERWVCDYDRLVWPHAGRGFFQLRKRIPGILEELRLG